jgi:hypothetical protein
MQTKNLDPKELDRRLIQLKAEREALLRQLEEEKVRSIPCSSPPG